MALHDMLGLLGKAITADADPDEWERIIREAPHLTADERADLLRIPYGQLRPYQDDFYAYESSMIQWGFEATWAFLACIGYGVSSHNARSPERTFMVGFKNRYPCRTHSVRELGRQFVRYLEDDCPQIRERLPWIHQLAEAERLEIESLYDQDSRVGIQSPGTALAGLTQMSVDELLNQEVVRADGVSSCIFTCDIQALKAAAKRLVETSPCTVLGALAFNPPKAPQALIISRDRNTLKPVWHHATRIEIALLESLDVECVIPLEELAERFCALLESTQDSAERLTEQEMFTAFLALVVRWLELRYLLLAAA